MELDSNVRRVSNGTALLGGSPFRLIRLSTAGARLLDSWLAGDRAELSANARQLQQRLLQAGMIHPVVDPFDRADPLPSVAFVVPVHDDPDGLAALLSALRRDYSDATIVVVDDASQRAEVIANVAAQADATLVRHPSNRGPGAARNTGWNHVEVTTDLVMFIDADVVPESMALARVFAHFGDTACVAVAPRVQAASGFGLLDSYEAMQSPLDLGEQPGLVRAGARTSYVPSAALAIRRSTLVDMDGFDENMRFGEDVDLIWRLTGTDAIVRYEPAAVVRHRNRRTSRDLARQRFGYGSSAAPLANRHGDAVTPLRLPLPMLAGWIAALFGGPFGRLAAVVGGVGSIVKLADKLDSSVERPGREAARLMAQAHVGVAGALVNAANRNYAPLMLLTRGTRRLLLAGAVMPPLIAWCRKRPRHNPLAHIALKAVDDNSYCAGVWAGAWRERSFAALLPDVDLPKKQHD